MDLTAVIDGTVSVLVMVGAVWSIVLLTALGMARSAALGDEAMWAYLDEEYGTPDEDPFDQQAREWIAAERSAS